MTYWHWHLYDLVCGDVGVQCDDHVCAGGRHHGRPQGPEEHFLCPHLSLHNILHNINIMPGFCA